MPYGGDDIGGHVVAAMIADEADDGDAIVAELMVDELAELAPVVFFDITIELKQ
jgi:hypothetical protein